MLAGIASGLAAAFFQSLSYLATRQFTHKRAGGAGRQLLVLAHVWMGILSLAVVPFVWPAGGVEWAKIAYPLAGVSVFYLGGQFGLMMALKHAEPSRVSPLLGFKIVILAAMASVLTQPVSGTANAGGLTVLQWVAVVLCVGAAVSLNYSGAVLQRKAVAGILLACVSYSLSDWHITMLVGRIREGLHLSPSTPSIVAPVLATGLCYIVCGLLASAFLPWMGSTKALDWRDALPFAVLWFVAMMCLFTSFGIVGVVLGNILQSTRGLMSIVLASILINMGHHHFEAASTRHVFLRRLASGTVMFAAVSLYVLKDSANIRELLSRFHG